MTSICEAFESLRAKIDKIRLVSCSSDHLVVKHIGTEREFCLERDIENPEKIRVCHPGGDVTVEKKYMETIVN